MLESLKKEIGRRYRSLDAALSLLPGSDVVELGCARSFKAGRIERNPATHNEIDRTTWDWGSGLFSYCVKTAYPGSSLVTVDVDPAALEVSKVYLRNFIGVTHVRDYSENYLLRRSSPIDLLYMDSGESGEPSTIEAHKNEAEIVVWRKLISVGGLILIDDYDVSPSDRKCLRSLPFLLDNGFEILLVEYQLLLRRIR